MEIATLKLLALTAGLVVASIASAWKTDDIPPEKQLDFWIGNWTVEDTTPGAKKSLGTNKIERLYDGKVIHENFKMGTFEGQSWSVYNPQAKLWQQTWVDNGGGYIAMRSTLADGDLAIQTLTRETAPLVASRMVFSNVKPNAFTWRWEATKDGGKTWTLNWRLQYTRAK